MMQYSIKVTGVLCETEVLSIGWPERHEFDLITTLRNNPRVRRWFLNTEVIDVMKNREWLERLMDRPKEALLSIRLKSSNILLGTVGWSDWNPDLATAWFGRIALDLNSLRQYSNFFPLSYPGVALDATRRLRDYAFESMKLDSVFTYYAVDNLYAARLNKKVGMVPIGFRTRSGSDQVLIETVELKMDRSRWLAIKAAEESPEQQCPPNG